MSASGTVCDFSELTAEQFWVAMARRNFLWPCKPDGSGVSFAELPKLLPDTLEGESGFSWELAVAIPLQANQKGRRSWNIDPVTKLLV